MPVENVIVTMWLISVAIYIKAGGVNIIYLLFPELRFNMLA